jgi:hypothetical protein
MLAFACRFLLGRFDLVVEIPFLQFWFLQLICRAKINRADLALEELG